MSGLQPRQRSDPGAQSDGSGSQFDQIYGSKWVVKSWQNYHPKMTLRELGLEFLNECWNAEKLPIQYDIEDSQKNLHSVFEHMGF